MVAALFILFTVLQASLSQYDYTMSSQQCNLSLEELKGVISDILRNIQREATGAADYSTPMDMVSVMDIDMKPMAAGMKNLMQDLTCVIKSTPHAELKAWLMKEIMMTQTGQTLMDFQMMMGKVLKPAIDGFMDRYVHASSY